MSETQLRRMDVIEGWRQKTFVLSRTDRLGRLIAKTLIFYRYTMQYLDPPRRKRLRSSIASNEKEKTAKLEGKDA
ncbi:hypothetical protein PRIPAC_75154 [Pristionchus pacificus]|uniref:Uncharacterized protein n=1 Tax=Pristionchus pacificus TaxID=54126 RepID=A0A2A6C858_PRIPA|nr:hypothetical protein PRIPAC_75154 [Pristionchus pacificus]|eukprot:PDM74392.1 hypothetical protein PRIPAC_41748 [Pristionchus pacificus]